MKQMKRWSFLGIKYLLILSFIVPILTACAIADTVSEQYPLESVNGSGNATSYVYRAAGQSVPEVANALIDKKQPQQQSSEDPERMFLVYSNEIIHLQRDPNQPSDTLIEVDSKEYVRQNYNPGFLEGYLLAQLLDDLFDHGRHGGKYRGYTSKDVYTPKGTYHKPTIDEKKMAPPITVERSGSIFRRSKDANSSTVAGSNPEASPSKGKIVRGGDSQNTKNKSIFTKPKKSKAPKIRVGRGKIGRRR